MPAIADKKNGLAEDKAKEILADYELMKTHRSQYERPWQDIRELVRPNAQDFYRQATKGDTRTENIFDGTAVQANEELASALSSYMVSPTERWFSFEIDNSPEANQDKDVRVWLEQVADAVYAEYQDDRTSFNSSVFEDFLDIGSFGNCILNQEWNDKEDCLVFRAIPLAQVVFCEDQYGKIDKVYRCIEMNKRQLAQKFGKDVLPRKVEEAKADAMFEVIHGVYPNDDSEYGKEDSSSMAFKSCWILKDPAIILKESGYESFPYHCARWSKVSGEIYGRGPAIKCLPDIKMLNRMEITMLRAAQKAVDPPLMVPNDGILLPLKTHPGSLIFHESGMEDPVRPLVHGGDLPIGLEMSDQKRAFINRCFYADWVKLMPKKERQTAYEISELVEQQLRMMAPMLGRIQTELLGPMLSRTIQLLGKKNRFPKPPPSIDGATMKIVYISAAARAQIGSKATLVGRFFQEVIPIAQVYPDAIDALDFDTAIQKLAVWRGVDPSVIRGPEELAAIRQSKQQQQAMAAAAQVAEPASQAVLNLSKANEAGNIV